MASVYSLHHQHQKRQWVFTNQVAPVGSNLLRIQGNIESWIRNLVKLSTLAKQIIYAGANFSMAVLENLIQKIMILHGKKLTGEVLLERDENVRK